jgi:hypothetical protein
MTKIDERTSANVDVVLEETCRDLPNGGDHESRKYVTKKLMQSVKKLRRYARSIAVCGQRRAF